VAKISYPGLDLTHLYIGETKGAQKGSKVAVEEAA
jgi:hypothetical protein